MDKIALTIWNKEKPVLTMDFVTYAEARTYWRERGKYWRDRSVTLQRVTKEELKAIRASSSGHPVPACGDGYRYLTGDEHIESGDEWWSTTNGVWMETRCKDSKPVLGTTYRRSVSKYLYLQEGDKIIAGDEYSKDGKVWRKSKSAGVTLNKLSDGRLPLYRRVVPKRDTGELPDKYRMLLPHEIVTKDDLVWNGFHWSQPILTGAPVGRSVGLYARKTDELMLVSTAGES